jgi:cathepsin D
MQKCQLLVFFLSLLIYLIKRTNCQYYSFSLNKKILNNHSLSNLLEEAYKIHEIDHVEYTDEKLKLLDTQKGLIQKMTKFMNDERKLEVSSVYVTNYFNVQYYGDIYIGSVLQKLSVILDTGSNILWVATKNCERCRNFTQKFDFTLSKTFRDLNVSKNITYAIGYVNGSFVQDNVLISLQNTDSFNGMGVKDFKFLLVNDEKALDGTISDGVLGLGIDLEGDASVSLISMLHLQGQISKPFFSFFLTDSKKGSRLYIGDITQNEYLGPLFNQMKFCSVKDNAHYWQCDVQSLSFHSLTDKQNSNLELFSSSKVIFDTGTSFLIIPANDFILLLPKFSSKALNNKCGITPYLQFICQCSSPRDFDDIRLNLQNSAMSSEFYIKVENLIQYFPSTSYQCKFEILIDIFMMDAWILGDSVLRDSLLTFDMQKRQIGWVQNIDRLTDSMIFANKSDDVKNFTWWLLGIVIFIISLTYIIVRMAKCYAATESRQENLLNN